MEVWKCGSIGSHTFILPYFHTLVVYSVFKLFVGFATAAFIAWKLTVIMAIKIAIIPASANIHQLMGDPVIESAAAIYSWPTRQWVLQSQ